MDIQIYIYACVCGQTEVEGDKEAKM